MRTTGKLLNIEAIRYDRCVYLMGAEPIERFMLRSVSDRR